MEQTVVYEKRSFSVGDAVVYRAEGVCDVVDVRKESFGAQTGHDDYYILSPRNDANSSIYVPVHNEALTALMRPILSREEIAKMLQELREDRLPWPAESRARNLLFRDILSRGDRREMVVLVLTIQEHIIEILAAGKKVGSTESGALSRACKLLRDEFSLSVSLSGDHDLIALLRGEREI